MVILGVIGVHKHQFCYNAFSMTKTNVFLMEKPPFCKLKWRNYHGRFLYNKNYFYNQQSRGYKSVKRGLGLDYPLWSNKYITEKIVNSLGYMTASVH